MKGFLACMLALGLSATAFAAPAARISGRVVLVDTDARVRIAPKNGEKVWVRDTSLQEAASRLGLERVKEDLFYLWVDVRLDGADPEANGRPGYFLGHIEVEKQPVAKWLEK